jgi:nicotinamide riboside transporter PnuC
MGSARSFSVFEISASTFANSSNSKASQKDKQPNNDNNNEKKKGNIVSVNIISILRLLICYSIVFALQKATIFKDGNIIVHSFLDTALLYKCKGDFYNAVPITRIEDNNIKLLWLTMIILIIGLTMLFNSYIIPTEDKNRYRGNLIMDKKRI